MQKHSQVQSQIALTTKKAIEFPISNLERTVLAVEDMKKDYQVTVEFDTAGVKKLFAGFAKLKKI
mgnify:CR=1 FL=1